MNQEIKEKVWFGSRRFYLRRGVDRTPVGCKVEIVQCNQGIVTEIGTLKDTADFALRNENGQIIACSPDVDDLYLFALDHGWVMDDPIFKQLCEM